MVKSQAAANTNSLLQYGGKLLFRIMSVVSAIAYSVLFLRLLEPTWQSMFGNSISVLDTVDGWLLLATSIAGAWLSVHIFTILARLLTMRMRVYGEVDRI